MEEKFDLKAAIEEYEKLSKRACMPWFHTKIEEDEHGYDMADIGPYNLNEENYGLSPENHTNSYVEKTIATFYGVNTDCEANIKLAVLSVNMVPALIARVRELEAKTSTELSDDVANSIEILQNTIDTLNKWRNRV